MNKYENEKFLLIILAIVIALMSLAYNFGRQSGINEAAKSYQPRIVQLEKDLKKAEGAIAEKTQIISHLTGNGG